MKIFLDSAIIKEIEWCLEHGILDGITTNPSLLQRTDRKLMDVINDILDLVKDKPVSIETVTETADELIEEGKRVAKLTKNVVVKIVMTPEGMKATRVLASKGIKVNVTLIFSPSQALLAAKAGASYVSPFVGRLDDIKKDGMQVVREIVQIFKNYQVPTQVLAASMRNVRHVEEAALAGADIATCPFNVIQDLYKHELTDKGIAKFLEDWKKVPK